MEILPNYSSNSGSIRGQNIRALQKILEHKRIKTTMIYAHINDDLPDNLVKLIAQPADPQNQVTRFSIALNTKPALNSSLFRFRNIMKKI